MSEETGKVAQHDGLRRWREFRTYIPSFRFQIERSKKKKKWVSGLKKIH